MLRFELVSPTGKKFEGEVYEVVVPTIAGEISLFEGHMPVMTAAAPGIIRIRKKAGDSDGEMDQFAISGGIVEVDGQTVNFLSDEITAADEASEAEAEAALAQAQKLVAGATDQVALHEAKRMLQHSSAKLHVAKLKRRKHH